jgi:hypothetical protein
MHMNNEQWINGIKSMEKMIDYAKEIGLYNGIQERGKKTTIARRKRINQDSDGNEEKKDAHGI